MLKNPAIGHTLRRFVLAGVLALLAVLAATAQPAETEKSGRIVLQAALEGPIGPASARHIEKVLTEAGERSAQAIVLRIDTPGGLADTMRVIISEILESPVPVIGYVAPGGAHAASARGQVVLAGFVAHDRSALPSKLQVVSLGVGTKFMPVDVARAEAQQR